MPSRTDGKGGRNATAGERVGITVRLASDVYDRLFAVSQDRDVSMNRLVEKAVARYLDDLPPIDAIEAKEAG